MRNLREYPITKEETVRLLDSLTQKIQDEGAIGDTRGLVLKYIKEYITDKTHETDRYSFDDFLNEKFQILFHPK